jgi:hypothetical protein
VQLGTDRKTRIRNRLEPMLHAYDPELHFVTVFVDSTREDLGVVVQLRERPLLLKFGWVDFVSNPDEVLHEELRKQLDAKLASKP